MEIDQDIGALEDQIYSQTKHLLELTSQQMSSHKLIASLTAIPSQDVSGRFDTTVNSIGQKVHQISEELSQTQEQYTEKLTSLEQTLQAVNSNVDQLLETQQQLQSPTSNVVINAAVNVEGKAEIPVVSINAAISHTLDSAYATESRLPGTLNVIENEAAITDGGKTPSILPIAASLSTIMSPFRPTAATPSTPLTAAQPGLINNNSVSVNSANRRGDSILQSASKLTQASNQRKQSTNNSLQNNPKRSNNISNVQGKDPLQRLHDHLLPK